MDEELISEVQQHSVIYNRQKYFMNSVGQEKYESKDDAWREISTKVGTDVESCKKRWKYLRERYVQTRKQGDPPTYEHLSRPYLEKMNFLDQHIQPRKSYRNASSFLPSPNATFGEYMDSRSNGSTPKMIYPNYPDSVSIKSEPEPFQNFASVTCPPQHSSQQHPVVQPAAAAPIPTIPQQQQHPPLQQYQQMHPVHGTEFRENDITHIPSSSSSMKSPLSSPQTADQHDNSDSIKRPRLPPSRHHPNVEDDDSSDTEEAQQQHQREQLMNEARRKSGRQPAPSYPTNNDFLYSVYQRFAPPNTSRSSEQLLGELVTSELLKMNRERRKVAQRRILEVLFFED